MKIRGDEDVLYYIWSTVISYIVITAAMRILGKRQIGELQATELVVTFLIADLAVIPLQNGEKSLWSGIIPIIVLVLCEMTASWLMIKSGLFRRLVCGKPVVIIKEGKLVQSALKKLRITAEELFEELRLKDIFDLNDILYGIIETNGNLSVMLKQNEEPVKRKDLNISGTEDMMVTVITDGAFSEGSMKLIGVNKTDIEKLLSKSDLQKEDIFIMLMNSKKDVRIIQKES